MNSEDREAILAITTSVLSELSPGETEFAPMTVDDHLAHSLFDEIARRVKAGDPLESGLTDVLVQYGPAVVAAATTTFLFLAKEMGKAIAVEFAKHIVKKHLSPVEAKVTLTKDAAAKLQRLIWSESRRAGVNKKQSDEIAASILKKLDIKP